MRAKRGLTQYARGGEKAEKKKSEELVMFSLSFSTCCCYFETAALAFAVVITCASCVEYLPNRPEHRAAIRDSCGYWF